MKTINLHYAKIDLKENEGIIRYEFKSRLDLIKAVEYIINDVDYDCVWLLSKDESPDVFISENKESILEYAKSNSGWSGFSDLFLQAYRTYNDAYEVALMIAECYSNLTE